MPRTRAHPVTPERARAVPSAQGRGQRRLIAGLRVNAEDERLLALVAPLFPEVDSAGDLAYRLWRRGLELTLAEAVGLGAQPPPELSEELIAALAAQRLLLCLPLLRRTRMLGLLGITAGSPTIEPPDPPCVPNRGQSPEPIDPHAAAVIAGLGADDFL